MSLNLGLPIPRNSNRFFILPDAIVGKVGMQAGEGRGEGLRFLEEANFMTN